MKNLNLVLILMSALLPFASYAVEVTLLGGVNMASTNMKYNQTLVTTTTKSSTTMAGGVLFDFPAAMNVVMIETGIIYKKAKSKVTVSALGSVLGSSEDETTRLQIPILIRFTKLPIVSFGLGGYWEAGLGDVKNTDSAGTKTNISYANSGYFAPDYGLLGDIRFTFPVAPKFGLVLDANYSYGLAERSNNKADATSGYSLKSSALTILAGIKIAL